MSYTSYDYADLQLNTDEIDPDGTLRVTVKIANCAEVAGEEVADLYVGTIGAHAEWPVKELKGFNKVKLEAGETKEVAFDLSAR